MTVAANLLWDSPSVMARFEGAGTITPELSKKLGLVGPAARACGVERDVRQDFPWRASIDRRGCRSVRWSSGDVFARAYVRWLEIQRSATFIREQLNALPAGPCGRKRASSRPTGSWSRWSRDGAARSATWRSRMPTGRFAAYKIVDPSFHNWTGLAMALRDQQISDFPLCNKSFNLSYCGQDL